MSDSWRHLAACANEDTKDWVWINSHKLKDARKAARLKAICATCPVRVECLDAELAVMRTGETSYGVFGGTDVYERRELLGMSTDARRRQHHKPTSPMAHGTVVGYNKHFRYPHIYGPACDACKWANSQRFVEYRRQRAERIRVVEAGFRHACSVGTFA